MPATSERFPALRALRHRDFRLLWASLFISATGTWMQILANSLLVLHLTGGSSLALGTVSLTQALSFFLFAPLGGTVADRLDKRRLLLITQGILLLLAVTLGLLTLFGWIRFWMIVVLVFCGGAILSFDQPARNALVPSLVPPADLMNAVSLQSIIFSGAATFGPALAGVAVVRIGYAGNFFLNAASYLPVMLALWGLPPVDEPRARAPREPLWTSMRTMLGAAARDAALPGIIAGYGALLFLGPSPAVMLPIFALRVLHLSAPRMGFLFSAVGVGTILGGLAVASLGDYCRKGQLFLGAVLVWSAALGAFAASKQAAVSVGALLILGAAQTAAAATAITLMQTRVPANMRGRIMSLNTLLVMGVRPLGDFPAGALISLMGGPWTAGLSAALTGAYALFLAVRRPRLRSA
ncbi:MAG TPA: MFS transporter [Bryobacteraceae bacterium]|nr:MFS transporter [Bryobacteraceae bacterium]